MKNSGLKTVLLIILLPLSSILIYRAVTAPSFSTTFILPKNADQTEPKLKVSEDIMQNAFSEYVEQKFGTYPASNWISARQALFSRLLKDEKYDVLIVPFQIDRNAIDPVGRSLMSRALITSIRNNTGLRAPDSEFIEYALWENRRIFRNEDIYALASKLGVKTIIQGFAGYEQPDKLRITLRLTTSESGRFFAGAPSSQKTWDDLQFTDEDLPFEKFNSILPSIIDWLPQGNVIATTEKLKYKKANLPQPQQIEELLASQKDDPISAAYKLQLYGLLLPDEQTRMKERAFERSLLRLNEVSSESYDYRLLKSRALFHLSRRPSAMDSLGEPQNASEKALRKIMNGSATKLEEVTKKIERPFNRLIANLEMLALFGRYNMTAQASSVAEKLAIEYKTLGIIIKNKMNEFDYWYMPPDQTLKIELDHLFPLIGYSLEDIIKAHMASNEGDYYSPNYSALISKHAQSYIDSNENKLCCTQDRSGPDKLDMLYLYSAWAEASVIKRAYHMVYMQGKADTGIKIIEDAGVQYDGIPQILTMQAAAYFKKAESQYGATREANLRKAAQYASDSLILSGGQNSNSSWAQSFLRSIVRRNISITGLPRFIKNSGFYSIYVTDFPRRPYWDQNLSISGSRDYAPWRYESSSSYPLYVMAVKKFNSEGAEAADQFLEENKHRFEGDPNRYKNLTWYLETVNRKDQMAKVYQLAVEEGAQEWTPYYESGNYYVQHGEYAKARDLFLRYPLFSNAAAIQSEPVTFSNRAFTAGSLLFWKGAYEEAKPLYIMSAELKTGSAASIESRMRLALLNKDWETAVSQSLRRAKRYNSSYAYRDYMSLLHMLGYGDAAWSLFDTLITNMKEPHIWTAAFTGHRIQNMKPQDLMAWLRKRKASLPKEVQWLAGRYAFMSLLLDRAPQKGAAEFISETGEIIVDKAIAYHRPLDPEMLKRVSGKQKKELEERERKNKEIRERMILNEPEQAIFARAYNAIKQERYDVAYSFLHRLAQKHDARETDFALLNWQELPYYIRAQIKTGKQNDVTKFLKKITDNPKQSKKMFNLQLAFSLQAAAAGDHANALSALKTAFALRPFTENRNVFTWYQMLEIAEWLFTDSGDKRYIELALQWSKNYQIIQPMYGWAYAFEAKYSEDQKRRKQALGTAIYLDEQSYWISEISKADKESAMSWFKENNPFVIKSPKLKIESI